MWKQYTSLYHYLYHQLEIKLPSTGVLFFSVDFWGLPLHVLDGFFAAEDAARTPAWSWAERCLGKYAIHWSCGYTVYTFILCGYTYMIWNYYIVLYVLYYIILNDIILYCIISFYVIIILYYIILYCNMLCYVMLYYIILYYIILYIISYFIILYHILLYYIIWNIWGWSNWW